MKTKEKKPNLITETVPAEYRFSDSETLELAQRLAHYNTQLSELEDRRKSVTSEIKSQIELAQAQINALSMKITNGYELRDTDCVVTFDPENSSKDYHHARTCAFVRRAEMTRTDFQICLPIADVEASASGRLNLE